MESAEQADHGSLVERPAVGPDDNEHPINPKMVASPRRHRTFSPSRNTAVRIMKSGAVKLIAVESVRGNRVVA